MKKRIFLFCILIISAAVGVYYLIIRQDKKPTTQNQSEITIDNAQEQDLCNKINPDELKSILSIDYEKPNVTKVSVTGELASDTCTYRAKDGSTDKTLQIVIKYSSEGKAEAMSDAWKNQTEKLQNKVTINGINKVAFMSGNTVYILNDNSYITVTKNDLSQEQIKQIFSPNTLQS